MKVGLVYTSTTPELIEMVESEVKKEVNEVECLSYQDATILADVREAGYVTKEASLKLFQLYLQAANDEVEAILNVCSSVGEVADASKSFFESIQIPLVRIDEDMCRAAVVSASNLGGRIGVLATLPTTLNPTKNTILRVAEEMGVSVALKDGLFDAFGADQNTFQSLIVEAAEKIKPEVDVILLCQGSMAYCDKIVSEHCKIPVFSSPGFGARTLREALIQKGKLV